MTAPHGVGPPPIVPRSHLDEPPAPPPGRALVPYAPPGALKVAGPRTPADGPSPLDDVVPDLPYNPRRMSPREMAEASMDLYMAGALTWDEHAMLAFQPELQKDYDRTVGALIGERARPNKQRDFIRIWEERLAFERRYNAGDRHVIGYTLRILQVLRALARRKEA